MAKSFSLHSNDLYRSLSYDLHRRPSPLNKPMMKISMSSSQNDHESYLTSINVNVKAYLQKTLPICSPLSVSEPINHLVFAAPDCLAPALCIASYELVGGQRYDQAIAAASALHLVHAAMYTHQQLPLSDHQARRHHYHHLFKPGVELLCADGIMSLGFELLAASDDHTKNGTTHDEYYYYYSSERILRVVMEISRAMGSEGMCGGEYLLHQCSSRSCEEEDDDEGWIKQVCEMKEGGFYACGAACGAILGGGNEEEIEKLRKFGLCVGMMHGVVVVNRILGREENDEGLKEIIDELRGLALKELEGFKEENVMGISKLLDAKIL